MKMKFTFYLVAATLLFAACKSANNTQKGTGIGAAGGAAIGALIGGKKNSALGAVIGAAIGGGAGYAIGNSMDKQAREIKSAVPDAEVERVGEGINMTFNAGLLFKINSSVLNDSAVAKITNLAKVLKDYPDTDILIEGHTDDTGKDAFNLSLSEKRANSVADVLKNLAVSPTRLQIKWYGETQPKYPNDSEANRKLNRRVELAIFANEAMKEKAKQGKLQQ